MLAPPKSLSYVLSHSDAWRFLGLLSQGKVDRYEQVRKSLGMHPQAFLRLVHSLSAFDLVWIRGDRKAKRPRGGPVPVHVEISPRGRAMLEILRSMEQTAQDHREEFGWKSAELLSVSG